MFATMDRSLELLRAVHFAADKHRSQRRKGVDRDPYINHPIAVAEILARVAGVRNVRVLQAALLHDTIEDTETTPEELARHFGKRVRDLVLEVTDDRKLPREDRKRMQIEHAPKLSKRAKRIKLADKICNLVDIVQKPPQGWDHTRRASYLEWSRQVVEGCRGASPPLEKLFDRTLLRARGALAREERKSQAPRKAKRDGYAGAPAAARSRSGTTSRKRSKRGR
jgi:guanosine-3',5'-bis(diphosphate) 3'-pyrophosphohydrolase